MFRYRWEIQTADSPYSGTDGQVTLSLHGTSGVTDDFPLQAEGFSKGELTRGVFEADEDLGEITSGSLYTKLDPGRPWEIAYVRITNLVTGKAWIADGVGACTQDGCPLLRFEVDRDASAEVLDNTQGAQQNKEGTQEAKADRQTSPDRRADRLRALVRRFKESLELLQQLEDPEQQTIASELGATAMPLVRKLLRKPRPCVAGSSEEGALLPVLAAPRPRARLEGGAPSEEGALLPVLAAPRPRARPETGVPSEEGDMEPGKSDPQLAPQFLTIELFATLNGRKLPLTSVLTESSSGTLAIAPGARVLMTDQPQEGFGLGGRPGAWSFGPPSAFGIDGGDVGFVALDGFSVKPLGALLLRRLFGDWRSVLLGTSAPLGAQGDGK